MPTQNNIQVKLADLPEVSESFGDAIRGVWFDGSTWRIDVDVSRLNATVEGQPISTTQYPSCRLVLSPGAGLALLERLTALAKELEANGTLQRNPPTPKTAVTH
jgi:hypothetical protein